MLLASIRSRLRGLTSEALNSIELELSATRMPAEMLAEHIEAFHTKAAEILQEQSDTEYLLRGEISVLLAKVEADLRAFVDDHVQLLTSRISAAFERHQHLGTGKLIEAMNAAIACAVEAMFAHYYYIDDLFILQLSRLPLLLPASLAKRYIRGQFLSSCREQLDLNAGRRCWAPK